MPLDVGNGFRVELDFFFLWGGEVEVAVSGSCPCRHLLNGTEDVERQRDKALFFAMNENVKNINFCQTRNNIPTLLTDNLREQMG